MEQKLIKELNSLNAKSKLTEEEEERIQYLEDTLLELQDMSYSYLKELSE